MSDNIFDELVNWWTATHRKVEQSEGILGDALKDLGIISESETVCSHRIEADWVWNGEETYLSVGSVDIEGEQGIRTVTLAAYAVVTPPPLPIEERIDSWKAMAELLADRGVRVPEWYLVWNGTIFTYRPPFALTDYVTEYPASAEEDLIRSLAELLWCLARLGIRPLGLLGDLRTDSFEVYYCGMGFDVGDSTDDDSIELLRSYEESILPHLPVKFRNKYLEITTKG